MLHEMEGSSINSAMMKSPTQLRSILQPYIWQVHQFVVRGTAHFLVSEVKYCCFPRLFLSRPDSIFELDIDGLKTNDMFVFIVLK